MLSLLLAATVQVTGKTECPSPIDVTHALETLLTDGPSTRADEARISVVGDELLVELVNSEAATEARRTLDRHGSCDDIAQKVAVVIALWESNLEVGPLPAPAAAPPARVDATEAAVAPPARQGRWLLSPSLGVLASLASGAGVSAAGEFKVTTGARERPYRAFLSLIGVSAHERDFDGVPGASTQWSRVSLAAGPGYDAAFASFSVVGDVGMALGRLWTRGRGFDVNHQSATWDASALASLRLVMRASNNLPWVGLIGAYGLSQKRVATEGARLERDIPRAQVLLGAGVGLGFFL